LNDQEVEAVIGHELGHLKHRDVQVMMFVSILPAIFYYIGISLLFSSLLGGGNKRNGASAAAIGAAFMAFYFILTLFTLQLSRTREYYADSHSAAIVDDGARKLSVGLAKIVNATARGQSRFGRRNNNNTNAYKALFITDPDTAAADARQIGSISDNELVERVLQRRITTLDRIHEVLSTHPNIVKRLRALKELEKVKA
jgi:heat shock protein HtpX